MGSQNIGIYLLCEKRLVLWIFYMGFGDRFHFQLLFVRLIFNLALYTKYTLFLLRRGLLSIIDKLALLSLRHTGQSSDGSGDGASLMEGVHLLINFVQIGFVLEVIILPVFVLQERVPRMLRRTVDLLADQSRMLPHLAEAVFPLVTTGIRPHLHS